MSRFFAGALTFLVAACAAPAPASPTPSPADTQTPTATATATAESTPTPTVRPTPTPGPTSALDGIWVSSRITHDHAAETINDIFEQEDIDAAIASHQFVDYMISELVVGDGRWSQIEIDDGIPNPSHFTGTFAMSDDSSVAITNPADDCEIDLTANLSADGTLTLSQTARVCETPPALGEVANYVIAYQATPFRRVAGPGAPSPSITTPGEPPAPGPTPASTSSQRLTLHPAGTVDGTPLGFAEYLPPDYETTPASPLLLFLPNAAGAGDQAALEQLTKSALLALLQFDAWPDERPFVVLAPQHAGLPPSYCHTPEEVDGFLTFAKEHYKVDPARIYLVGIQCGAIAGWNYLGPHPDAGIAAAVLFSGNGYGAVDEAGCALARVPIWALHGSTDEVTPARYSSYPIAFLQSCTAPAPTDARLTLYGNGFDSWTRTFNLSAGNDIFAWMLSKSSAP